MSKGEKKKERTRNDCNPFGIIVQTPFAKEVSTHPTMVSTQQPRFKGKKVDALSGQVDTGLSSQNSLFAELGQQVDTGPCSQNSLFSDLGQCVDTTTRAGRHTTERLQLKLNVCHVPPIGHPSKRDPNELSKPLEKFPLAARRVHLPLLLSWCLLKTNSHHFDCENWSLIVEEASEAPQGSRSSRSIRWRRFQGRSPSSKVQSIGWDFKDSSLFPI
ncbi:hypothetical protein Taro_001456 [Colocasia esculenta]|uniref:Uncharacterized protein n=1 Tax=Colocasia esculenta TaxID=4460 RepID=A0A843TA00_COLES|nr:hypothetical protein [Colocasia esculenta]